MLTFYFEFLDSMLNKLKNIFKRIMLTPFLFKNIFVSIEVTKKNRHYLLDFSLLMAVTLEE